MATLRIVPSSANSIARHSDEIPKVESSWPSVVDQIFTDFAPADANAIDDEGWTPLHVAASWGSDVAVDLLRQFSGNNLITDQRASCCETADELAQKNWDAHCLIKTIVPDPL